MVLVESILSLNCPLDYKILELIDKIRGIFFQLTELSNQLNTRIFTLVLES